MTTTTNRLARVRSLIEEITPSLVEMRHDLHAHPELGYAETRTSGVVQAQLEATGVPFEAGLAGGTGVVGHIGGAADGAIGLRADMDALPILEETGLPYASTTDGCMHACGHDGHTTILVGAARVLSALAAEEPLPNPVTFTFQPAEEGGAGGAAMVDDGCLDGSRIGVPVQVIYGLHGWPQIPLGIVATRPGPMLAAAQSVEIAVRGTGAHAAYPHEGRDAILCASAIVTALQQVASRTVDPLDSVVVSITQVHGGTTHNILPETVAIGGTLRYLHDATGEFARGEIERIVESTATAYGCAASVTMPKGYPVTSNDPAAVDRFNAVARATRGDDQVATMEHPVMGGEDFAFYGRKVPACFFALGLVRPGESSMPLLHQPTFDFTDEAIPIGVELFCQLALQGQLPITS